MSKHNKYSKKQEPVTSGGMKQSTLVIIFSVIGIIILSLFFVGPKKAPQMSIAPGANVHLEGGKQIIEIKAGGGYAPEKSTAKAGIPTVLRFTTSGSFDCSSSVRIPSLDLSKILPQTGTEDVDLGAPKTGPLQGMCGMGMYPFSIEFQ